MSAITCTPIPHRVSKSFVRRFVDRRRARALVLTLGLFVLGPALPELERPGMSSLLVAQQPEPARSGRVVEAGTEMPLPGARIDLRGEDGTIRQIGADAEGRFVVPDGFVAVRVVHPGYTSRLLDPDAEIGLVALPLSPFTLDQVTVTATRAAMRIEDAPGAVSVISSAALSRRNVGRLDHIVAMTPGVYNHRPNILDDSHGGLQLRGLTGQKRSLVLVDGIPMNDGYNGGFRFAGFAAEDLERVEVVRGPNSSLYGGYAMAGVVNYVTRMPEGRALRADVGYGPGAGSENGMRNQRKLYLSAGERFGPVAVLASFRRFATDGYVWNEVLRPASNGAGTQAGSGWREQVDREGTVVYRVGEGGRRGIEEGALTARVSWEVAPATRLGFTAMRITQEHSHGQPNSLLREAGGAPLWSGSFTVDPNGPRRITLSPSNFLQSFGGKTHNFLSGSLETAVGPAAVRGAVGYNDYESWYSTYNANASFEGGSGRIVRNPAPSLVADLQSTLGLGSAHSVTFGGTVKRDGADLSETNLADWTDVTSTGDLRYEAGGEVLTMAAFAQDEVRIGDRVTAYLGVRMDRWETRGGYANDVGKPGYPQSYRDRSSSFVSPRLALVLAPVQDTRLKFSASRAFRGPTVFELYRTWTQSTGAVSYANPDLGPETVLAFDLGLQQRFAATSLGITVFHNDVRDLINRKTLEDNNSIFINTGRVMTRGVELEGEQRVGGAARLFANYTWTDTEVKRNEAAPATEGKRLTGAPEHMGNAGLEIDPGSWTIGAHGRYVGKRFNTDTNVDLRNGVYSSSDPYFLLDLKGSYRWRGVRTSVSVDNALDLRYYDFYLAPGRTLMVELGFALP